MNFYGVVLGLFKDFLLWLGHTMATVRLCVPGDRMKRPEVHINIA